MRMTGGIHRGRILRAPAGGARPTQDRVRAALYSAIAPVVPEARVLDLFAGSGALGLEAWSRGAASVTYVESAAASLRALRENLAALRAPADTHRVIAADVFRLLASPPRLPGAPFTLVLADPPYAPAREQDYLPRLAALLTQPGWLAADALFAYETDSTEPPPKLEPFALIFDRRYGGTRMMLFRRAGE